ncbi:hypothetical protein JHK87_001210 [Glycine soja]|nr:hypothetical protein JHK87_001210 [Glycine soja]
MHARRWRWEPPCPTVRTTKIVSSEGGAVRVCLVARSTWTRIEDRWRLVDSTAAVVDMHVPLLLMHISNNGVCVGVGEGSTICYGVVIRVIVEMQNGEYIAGGGAVRLEKLRRRQKWRWQQ